LSACIGTLIVIRGTNGACALAHGDLQDEGTPILRWAFWLAGPGIAGTAMAGRRR